MNVPVFPTVGAKTGRYTLPHDPGTEKTGEQPDPSGVLQQYNVEFVPSTEKSDTSALIGRAMLNICIVFTQLERETIQKQAADTYYSRSLKGFCMGGKAPYGFRTEPIQIDGIHTKKLVANPEEAKQI